MQTSQDSEYADEQAKMQARREFLAHLPPATHEYRYNGLSSLEKIADKEYTRFLEHRDSSYIIFTEVAPQEIENQDLPGRVDYNSHLHILILKMVSSLMSKALAFLMCSSV